MQIGDQVKDRVSGFEGIAVGKIDYLNGCRQFLVQPAVDDKGAYRDGVWIDEQKLEVQAEQVERNPFADNAPPTVGYADRRVV